MRAAPTRALTCYLLFALAAACDAKRDEKPRAAPPLAPAAPAQAVPSGAAPKRAVFDPTQLNFFAALPESVDRPVLDPAAAVGREIFFDTKLSKGGDSSCASCHDLAQAGSSARKGKLEIPTIINAAGAFAQGWTARSTTVEEFVVPHVADVMGSDDKKIGAAAASRAAALKKAFPDEASPASALPRALGAYAKKLFARSRFDRYLSGDTSALTADELEGLATFVDAGCTTCHQGKHLGATQAQKLGLAKPWPPPAGSDPGRFEVTKQEADRGMFKVSALRNVTRTAPYLHDGSVATLEETVRLMARHQVGREVDDAQIKAIVLFLGTLEGTPSKDVAAKPH